MPPSPGARAKRLGIQTEYVDAMGERRSAGPDAVAAVLRAMDEITPPDAGGDTPRLDPVTVAWAGQRAAATLTLPSDSPSPAKVRCTLRLEDGDERAWTARPTSARRNRLTFPLPDGLPHGYHTLTVEAGRESHESTVFAAPSTCYTGDNPRARDLGVFAPLYGLRSDRGWGVGDLTDLQHLARWSAAHGAPIVGTLPMLATYLDEPFEPSPYAPVSRLFWNELYLDPGATPEWSRSDEARRLAETPDARRVRKELRDGRLVDYRRAAALKRPVLAALARAAFADPRRKRELDAFARTNPLAKRYAAFRAAADRRRETWHAWEPRARAGTLTARDYDEADFHTHLYAQHALGEGLDVLHRELADAGGGLYLDLPVGVHASGFDTWAFPGLFVPGVSVGAPPDPLFSGGQNWGFPPMDPRASRRTAHAYFRLCLRSLMARCSVLRIDHVMALHRLFWIPEGFTGADGMYIAYPADELYAALAIESHRARVRVVGENLGTVPPEVDKTLKKRRVMGMFVGQFSFSPTAPPTPPSRSAGAAESPAPFPPPDPANLASLNTHDTPTFAAFWHGSDVGIRREIGLIDDKAAAKEARDRRRLTDAVWRSLKAAGLVRGPRSAAGADAAAVRALHTILAAGPARIVLLTLEDLWLEAEPQNVPGTSTERPNWRRKLARTLEEITADPELAAHLLALAAIRADHTGTSNGRAPAKRKRTPTRPARARKARA